jgi:hypothetical protein
VRGRCRLVLLQPKILSANTLSCHKTRATAARESANLILIIYQRSAPGVGIAETKRTHSHLLQMPAAARPFTQVRHSKLKGYAMNGYLYAAFTLPFVPPYLASKRTKEDGTCQTRYSNRSFKYNSVSSHNPTYRPPIKMQLKPCR